MVPGEKIALENLDQLINQHMAFLIRTVSNFTGKYVSIENDDEFSIALIAFTEAVKKYDEDRGNFLGFAKLVIESRLKTYLGKKRKESSEVSLEAMQAEGIDFAEEKEENSSLHEEIIQYREELLLFGLTLEVLADRAPKHSDTRKRAVTVAEIASEDKETVEETYLKKKLPIRKVARLSKVTEKIVKGSKEFILSVLIIFVKQFPGLVYWIKGERCHHHVS